MEGDVLEVEVLVAGPEALSPARFGEFPEKLRFFQIDKFFWR